MTILYVIIMTLFSTSYAFGWPITLTATNGVKTFPVTKTGITSKASPAATDVLLILDSADNNKLKRINVNSLPTDGATGYDGYNVHVVNPLTETYKYMLYIAGQNAYTITVTENLKMPWNYPNLVSNTFAKKSELTNTRNYLTPTYAHQYYVSRTYSTWSAISRTYATWGGLTDTYAVPNYLVGTADTRLTNEIVVGTTPGGELGGTWASPTVDATHSGTAHHTQSHAMTSASDHTAGNWKVFYSDGSANLQELALGAANKYLMSNGAAAAPSFESVVGGTSEVTNTFFHNTQYIFNTKRISGITVTASAVTTTSLKAMSGTFASAITATQAKIENITGTHLCGIAVGTGEHKITATSNIDFQGYKGIAMSCDHGSVVPTSPTEGQWFLHTPTGRKVLMQYAGSAWNPIISIGTMTLYVDSTDGTDAANKGTGVDVAAYKTIQYAFNSIPPTFTNNVTININGETYNENLVLNGKNPSGDYKIIFQGTLTELQRSSTNAAVTANSGATQGTIAHADFSTDRSNKLAYLATSADYQLIDSHAGTTFTMVGACVTDTDQIVIIYDWATTINGGASDELLVNKSQTAIQFYDIAFTSTSTLGANSYNWSEVYFDRCSFNSGMAAVRESYIQPTDCYVYDDAAFVAYISVLSTIDFYSSKIVSTSTAAAVPITVLAGGYGIIRNGSIVDCTDKDATDYGISIQQGGFNTSNTSATGYDRIRNCGIGIYATINGTCISTANNQYLNNTTDETMATGGQID